MAAKKKYPFDELIMIGDAFDVPMSSVKETSLRAYVYRVAAATGVDLSVRAIPDAGVFEVSRVDRTADLFTVRKSRQGPARRTRAELMLELARLKADA